MLREHGQRHWLKEREFANGAVAAAPSAAAAGAAPDRESINSNRIAMLENLRIGYARVGHVTVHCRGSVEARSGAASAAHGLVVPPSVSAEQNVVHRSLTARTQLEGLEQRVND